LGTIFPPPPEDVPEEPLQPDRITGYVWQRSAPSQRRKDVAIDPSFFALQLSAYPQLRQNAKVMDTSALPAFLRTFDRMPVIDTHKVGIMYAAPGQTDERAILGNRHGSPAYTRFLEGLGRLINIRGQVDVYVGGLDPDEDGEYAYAWWDDIGQVLYHTATLMPNHEHDPHHNLKKRHIGNDFVRIVWNDSGAPYKFDTLATEFQFCNIVIEAHSLGAIAAFSNKKHENEYFRVTVQRAPGMSDFAPVGDFKLISAENLPLLVRQLSLLADWYTSVYRHAMHNPGDEMATNWRARLQALKRFAAQQRAKGPEEPESEPVEGIMAQESARDFTSMF
jgi:tuberous sclerosis protein 2